MTEPIKLPPLPDWFDGYSEADKHVVQKYATAAVEADRQANQITGETSDGYHTFNELYAHRVRLFCLLMHAHKNSSWWSRKHHDGSAWEGWIIAGINTPEGSATYHLPESEIENLPEGTELSNGKEWDGHTSDDVLVRLLSLRQTRGEPVQKLSNETIRLVGVIANKIEDGTLFNAGILSRKELAEKVRGVLIFAAQTAPQPQQQTMGEPVATVSRKGNLIGNLVWTDTGRSADLPDGTMLYTAPEPKGK